MTGLLWERDWKTSGILALRDASRKQIWEVLVPIQAVFYNALHNEQMVFKKKKWALQRGYFRHTEEMMKVDLLRSCDMG